MAAAMPDPYQRFQLPPTGELEVPSVPDNILAEFESAKRYMVGDDTGIYTERKAAHKDQGAYLDFGWVGDVEKTGNRFYLMAAKALVDEIGTGSEEEKAGQIVDSALNIVLSEGDLEYTKLLILSSAEKVSNLSRYAGIIIPEVEKSAQTPAERFTLMQLLAEEIDYSKDIEAEQGLFTLQVLYAFDGYDKKVRGDSFMIAEEVERGDFDSSIAAELLAESMQPPEDYPTPDIGEVGKILKLTQVITGIEDAGELIAGLSRRDALDTWPEACTKVLEARKRQYLQRLRENRSCALGFLNWHAALLYEGDPQTIQQAGDDMALAIASQRSANTSLLPRERLRDQAIVMSRRRMRRLRSVGNAATNGAATGQEGDGVQTRELVHIDSNGAETRLGDEHDQVVSDYVEKHPGEIGLRDDVQNMLDYLKGIDLSSGLPRGIKKLNKGTGAIRFGERLFSKIYRLNPCDAVGLPTSSVMAEKVRIVFVMEKGKIGVVEILDKDEFPALQQKLGIGRAHRK